MCKCSPREFDLAKDKTIEGVILDKMSADFALEEMKKFTHYAPTGTFTRTPRRFKKDIERVEEYADCGITVERFPEDCNGCQ